MKALVAEFGKQSSISCEIIVGSSGKLSAQIKEGAPYDIFVAADMKYPQNLFDSGHVTKAPKPYAYGRLVLWTAKDDIKPSIAILNADRVQHIALANPKTAPYGRASMEIMRNYKILDEIEDKFVYGESVSQTNQFILSQSAEIGFTALSVVMSPSLKNKGSWTAISDSSYTLIEQGASIINRKNESKEGAVTFYRFLYSPEAKTILKQYGYSVDE
ncbi:MAG: molybdate transport system substrate-binding protein [Saprospiraceae bacterium]|jgi:molybdate transport system substrate-binding protein